MSAWDQALTDLLYRARKWELRLPKPHLRHNKEPLLVSHRFPVKNGMTMGEALAWQMYRANPIFSRLSESRSIGLPISENT